MTVWWTGISFRFIFSGRGYPVNKVQENVECEIMQVILDEARESYALDIVQELRSDKYEDLEQNVERVQQWLENWKKEHTDA